MNSSDRFDKLDDKIDRIDSRLDKVEQILAVNTQILDEHQRRSTTLENRFIKEMTPVKDHVQLMTIGFKVVSWISIVVVSILGVVQLLKNIGVI
jgi:hypothetical protein